MNNYKKLLLWGSLAVAVLAGVIVFLFCNLSSGSRKDGFVVSQEEESVYSGIPFFFTISFSFPPLLDMNPILMFL